MVASQLLHVSDGDPNTHHLLPWADLECMLVNVNIVGTHVYLRSMFDTEDTALYTSKVKVCFLPRIDSYFRLVRFKSRIGFD